jgi:hypothetical protein
MKRKESRVFRRGFLLPGIFSIFVAGRLFKNCYFNDIAPHYFLLLMRYLYLLGICLCSTLLSCNKEEDTSGGDKIPVINGYRKFDIKGEPWGIEGTPDDHVKETDSTGAVYQVFYLPNPCLDRVTFRLFDPYDQQAAKHIRLIRAKANGKIRDPHPLYTNDPYWNKTALDTVVSGELMQLDMTRFPYGYYRLEVTMSGRQFYAAILRQESPQL